MLHWKKQNSVSYCMTIVRATHTCHWAHVWGATNCIVGITDQVSFSSPKTPCVLHDLYLWAPGILLKHPISIWHLKKEWVSPWRTEPWARLSSLSDLVPSHEDVPCSWLLWWCLSCCTLPVALGLQALSGPRGSETCSSFRDTSSCSREVTGVTAELTASNYALENTLSLGPFCGYLSWKCGINLYAAITYNGNSTSSCMFFSIFLVIMSWLWLFLNGFVTWINISQHVIFNRIWAVCF